MWLRRSPLRHPRSCRRHHRWAGRRLHPRTGRRHRPRPLPPQHHWTRRRRRRTDRRTHPRTDRPPLQKADRRPRPRRRGLPHRPLPRHRLLRRVPRSRRRRRHWTNRCTKPEEPRRKPHPDGTDVASNCSFLPIGAARKNPSSARTRGNRAGHWEASDRRPLFVRAKKNLQPSVGLLARGSQDACFASCSHPPLPRPWSSGFSRADSTYSGGTAPAWTGFPVMPVGHRRHLFSFQTTDCFNHSAPSMSSADPSSRHTAPRS